jgi:hypothetical protein
MFPVTSSKVTLILVLTAIAFKKEYPSVPESEQPQLLDDYLLNYFKDILKAPHSEPIQISRDHLIEMLMKVLTNN